MTVNYNQNEWYAWLVSFLSIRNPFTWIGDGESPDALVSSNILDVRRSRNFHRRRLEDGITIITRCQY